MDDLAYTVERIGAAMAADTVVREHYLHRRPPISYAYGLFDGMMLLGVVTFGVPASRHLQKSACPTQPDLVIELNRLWVEDGTPDNTESWFVSKALRLMPPRIVVSYADPQYGHVGYIYRALNFRYAGWTDMERKTPRPNYMPANPNTHTRDAFRNGYATVQRRTTKIKYWTVTGNRADRRHLAALCPWPSLSWHTTPPPIEKGGAK